MTRLLQRPLSRSNVLRNATWQGVLIFALKLCIECYCTIGGRKKLQFLKLSSSLSECASPTSKLYKYLQNVRKYISNITHSSYIPLLALPNDQAKAWKKSRGKNLPLWLDQYRNSIWSRAQIDGNYSSCHACTAYFPPHTHISEKSKWVVVGCRHLLVLCKYLEYF